MFAARSVLLLHGVQSSHTTWWRAAADLAELGWRVTAPDLLGHGGRAEADTSAPWIDVLAADVLAQCAEADPFDLVVGHSLGAIVALAAAGREPGLARGVVLEDPPGLGAGGVDVQVVADEIERDVAAAHRNPAARVDAVLAENPLWSRGDAEQSVANGLSLDARSASDRPGDRRRERARHPSRPPRPVAAHRAGVRGPPARLAVQAPLVRSGSTCRWGGT